MLPHQHPQGNIYVISGPSGVGKGTLCAILLRENPDLKLSVSATSRPIRAGEEEGVHYFYKTQSEFEAMIAHDLAEDDFEKHQLLEWAVYNGHYYGTPRQAVEEGLKAGQHVLLEIDTQGALIVKRKFPASRLIFIAPPGMDVLEQRLRSRGTEDEATIKNRLSIAQDEMLLQAQFDATFINAGLEACSSALLDFMRR